MQRSSIETIQSEINENKQDSLARNAIIAKTTRLQPELTFQMSEIEALYTGVELMRAGHLAQFFVSHEQFRNALRDLHRSLQLKPSSLKILFRDASFYYREGQFHVFRMGNYLVVNVQIPLTPLQLTHQLTAYYLQKIPLASPRTTEH